MRTIDQPERFRGLGERLPRAGEVKPAAPPPPVKTPQPRQMDMSDLGMIMKDMPKTAAKLHARQAADWAVMQCVPARPSSASTVPA